MASYLIQDIPEDKMKDFKTACAYFKQTMRQVFLDIIDIRIQHYRADIGQLKGIQKPSKRKGKKK